MSSPEDFTLDRSDSRQPARSREPQRRRTAHVSYDPTHATSTLEYEDLGTMSDLELPSFQRGGMMRTSLPIVRSASTSLERPLGLVFLVCGDQTKKSLLPNEITTLDTVRALFVRAFPGLTMDMLEVPRRKVYILDKSNNIYFQLEDLGEIVDRSVLKLHDTDNDEPQKVKERQEIRGRTVQMPLSRSKSRQGHQEAPEVIKSDSLPPQGSQDYQDMMQDQRGQWDMERRSRSRTPEPAERPRSLSAGDPSSPQRYSHSPDRQPTPERGPLNPIPENRQLAPGYREQGINFYETIGPSSPGSIRGQYPTAAGGGGHYDVPVPYSGYPTPVHILPQQAYIVRSTKAPALMHAQRAVGPGYDSRDGPRGPSLAARHPLPFAPATMAPADPIYQRSQSYRGVPPEREPESRSHSATPTDHKTNLFHHAPRNRIEKMEAQLASLTAWVHYQKSDAQRRDHSRSLGSTASDSSDTFPASSASSLSDIPNSHHVGGRWSGESSPSSVPGEISHKLSKLKSELHMLRRQQQLNMEIMREEFHSAFIKFKAMCSGVPEAENQVNFHQRNETTTTKNAYLTDKLQVTQELVDLESTVEELRNDVISRKCRVNISDVEGMALLLSNITKELADLKGRFPGLQENMKKVMDNEMTMVVSEEKFLKEEPVEIESSLKRCKKMTETLYTLKRLASVQDHRPPNIPSMVAAEGIADTEQKKMLLENIRSMVPDHDQRLQHMEAADASRERKKKISTQQEALKFGKSLELASRALRPPSVGDENKADEGNGRDEEGGQMEASIPGGKMMMTTMTSVSSKPVSSSGHDLVATVSSYYPPPPSSTVVAATVSTTVPKPGLVKPGFSSTLTTTTVGGVAAVVEKPTATVSAMTNATSSVTPALHYSSSLSKTSSYSSQPPASAPMQSVKFANLPLTETTERLSCHVQGGSGPVVHTVVVPPSSSSSAGKRVDAHSLTSSSTPPSTSSSLSSSAYTTTTATSSKPPPLPSKPAHFNMMLRNERVAPLADKETFMDAAKERPKSSPVHPQVQGKLTSPSKLVNTRSLDEARGHYPKDTTTLPDVTGHMNGHANTPKIGDGGKSTTVTSPSWQTAKSAFFGSVSSPSSPAKLSSSSASMPKMDSTGSMLKIAPGGTITLVLSGSASPKSPTAPGAFTIAPPMEMLSNSPNMAAATPSVLPSTSAAKRESFSGVGSGDGIAGGVYTSPSHSSGSEASLNSGKQKKVPPPPPPRKGSRPTSSCGLPTVNGGGTAYAQPTSSPPSSSSSEMPQFVGGVLGQHRLSGGPLSSTPKVSLPQRSLSTFERDIASGIYANLNRPDLQSQTSSPHQMIGQVGSSTSHVPPTNTNQEVSPSSSLPSTPKVTSAGAAVDRSERGSSSESTSSSSGTSMGSQQSVVSMVRSESVSVRNSSAKAKPEPPRRQSSLLNKPSSGMVRDTMVRDRKKTLNGVDL